MYYMFIMTFILLAMPITGSGWVEGSNVLLEPGSVCKKKIRITNRKLAQICSNETSLMREITRGINMSFVECGNQFKNSRWNCSTIRKSIKKILVKDTRETAFIDAITAAGITYEVTRACSTGNLLQCSCDKNHPRNSHNTNNNNNNNKDNNNNNVGKNNPNNRNKKKKNRKKTPVKPQKVKTKEQEKSEFNNVMPKGDWEWGGCDDNVNFGFRKARDFLDGRYRKRRDVKTLLKIHNHRAGRLAVKKRMRLECQCHGLSGSCTVKTCWKKLPKFSEVGAALKDHFDGAVKVMASNDGQSFTRVDPTVKPQRNTDLVYTEESPDFCKANNRTGSLGTLGRECNETSQGVDGCDLLCCNRGYERQTLVQKVNCNCNFIWCCEVQCQTCNESRSINTCR